jgi:hypothetical protein
MARLDRVIRYAAAFRLNHLCLWNTGSPAFAGDDSCADAIAFVISENIHRRHLTAEQKRDLVAKLRQALPGAAAWPDRAVFLADPARSRLCAE